MTDGSRISLLCWQFISYIGFLAVFVIILPLPFTHIMQKTVASRRAPTDSLLDVLTRHEILSDENNIKFFYSDPLHRDNMLELPSVKSHSLHSNCSTKWLLFKSINQCSCDQLT